MIWRRRKERKPTASADSKDSWGYEFYEAMYKAEAELREKMLARLATPTALTVSVFGALGLMLKEYARVTNGLPPGPYWSYFGHIFWLFFSLSCVSLAGSLYFLGRFWYGNEYQLMPTAAQLRAYHEQLKAHYAPYDGAEKFVGDAFRAFLLENYVGCATRAAEVNHSRTARLFKANGGLIVAALLALITYGIFIVPTVVHGSSGEAVAATSQSGKVVSCSHERLSPPLEPTRESKHEFRNEAKDAAAAASGPAGAIRIRP